MTSRDVLFMLNLKEKAKKPAVQTNVLQTKPFKSQDYKTTIRLDHFLNEGTVNAKAHLPIQNIFNQRQLRRRTRQNNRDMQWRALLPKLLLCWSLFSGLVRLSINASTDILQQLCFYQLLDPVEDQQTKVRIGKRYFHT